MLFEGLKTHDILDVTLFTLNGNKKNLLKQASMMLVDQTPRERQGRVGVPREIWEALQVPVATWPS